MASYFTGEISLPTFIRHLGILKLSGISHYQFWIQKV